MASVRLSLLGCCSHVLANRLGPSKAAAKAADAFVVEAVRDALASLGRAWIGDPVSSHPEGLRPPLRRRWRGHGPTVRRLVDRVGEAARTRGCRRSSPSHDL